MGKKKLYKYTDIQFINDLIDYFKVNTDKIDDYMKYKVNMSNTNEMYIHSVVKERLKEEIKNMTKYECTKCKKIWYTSDTKAKRCECGGKLINRGVGE